MFCPNYVKCILVSIWTIVQTIFHLSWTMYIFAFITCQNVPSHYGLVFIYLTYFYQNDCGTIKLDKEKVFSISNVTEDKNSSSILYQFLEDVLAKGSLPEQSLATGRSKFYLYSFLICDIVWVVTALLLLVGSFLRKQRKRVFIFYVPWLFMTFLIIVSDVASAVHYGFDLRKITNFTSWLKFVGVQNYDQFSQYDDDDESKYIAAIPSITMILLTSRFFIFWMINAISFFYIFNATVTTYQTKKRIRKAKSAPFQSPNADLNTSAEERIRKWKQFYGTSSSQSMINSSSSSNSLSSSNRSFNINEQSKLADLPSSSLSTLANPNKSRSVNSSSYFQYSDVADFVPSSSSMIDVNQDLQQNKLLNNHLPWSYVEGRDERLAKCAARYNPKMSFESATKM